MLDQAVELVEVSARDGLQNEGTSFSTEQKIELIRRCTEVGLKRIEVASFVNPGRVPAMADGEAVVEGLVARADVSYIGLVLNRRGLERALATGVNEINFAFAATETFNQRNQGASVAESVKVAGEIVAEAHRHGLRTTITVGAAFGCPFEGEVPVDRTTTLALDVAGTGVDEIAIADTIGVGVPSDVSRRIAAIRDAVGSVALRCHFHDTRNTAVANAQAAVAEGVRALDGSLGGLGGCPFAPGATGNVATEDLLYLLERSGLPTGVSHTLVRRASRWLAEQLGRPLPSALSRADWFPVPSQLKEDDARTYEPSERRDRERFQRREQIHDRT